MLTTDNQVPYLIEKSATAFKMHTEPPPQYFFLSINTSGALKFNKKGTLPLDSTKGIEYGKE
jgi:hypothetical protein